MMSELTLTFPATNPPSINQFHSGRYTHWAAQKRLLEEWRVGTQTAWWQVRRTTSAQAVVGQPCNLSFYLAFTTNRRRDPHNYSGTVVKACIDQLVHEGVWPDDNPTYVSVSEPVLFQGTETRIVISTREDP